jgi:hypothetical protein
VHANLLFPFRFREFPQTCRDRFGPGRYSPGRQGTNRVPLVSFHEEHAAVCEQLLTGISRVALSLAQRLVPENRHDLLCRTPDLCEPPARGLAEPVRLTLEREPRVGDRVPQPLPVALCRERARACPLASADAEVETATPGPSPGLGRMSACLNSIRTSAFGAAILVGITAAGGRSSRPS